MSAGATLTACRSSGVASSLSVDANVGTTVVTNSAFATLTAFAPRGFAVQVALPNNPGFAGSAKCEFTRTMRGDEKSRNFEATPRTMWSCLNRLKFKCGGTVLVRVAAQASRDFAASDFSASLQVAPSCAPKSPVGTSCFKP